LVETDTFALTCLLFYIYNFDKTNQHRNYSEKALRAKRRTLDKKLMDKDITLTIVMKINFIRVKPATAI
jgi:hypothetical protein